MMLDGNGRRAAAGRAGAGSRQAFQALPVPVACVLAAVLAVMLAVAPDNRAQAQVPAADVAQGVKIEDLTIATSGGKHRFKVEVMRRQEDLSRGLMFRRSLPPDRGMLFDFGTVKPVAMWMRNTYISLDMVFIDARGIVVNVATNTEPLSEETIASARPVLSVLEVIAGTAKRIGLKPGDLVVHSLFRNAR